MKRIIPRKAFSLHKERSARIRNCLVNHIAKIPSKKVAIGLSSGVDSHALLFAALEAKKIPTVYSFTLNDRESRDFVCARRTAFLLGLKFVPVILDTALDTLKKYILTEIYGPANSGWKLKKSTVECSWPMFRLLDQVKEPSLILGINGDAWYCTSRSHKKLLAAGKYHEEVQKYYEMYHGGKVHEQIALIEKYLELYNPKVQACFPHTTKCMFRVMDKMEPIDEGCNPIEKAPVRFAFWDQFEYCRDSVYTHQSYHKGDSGIQDLFTTLLATELNTKGYKSTVGIYNDQLRKWREEDAIRNGDHIFK